MSKRFQVKKPADDGEFLWLVSLSDLMILLFIFFVVLFSFTYKKLKEADFKKIAATLRNEKLPPNPVEVIGAQLEKFVKDQKLETMVDVKKSEDMVTMEIKDQAFFASGAAEPHTRGIELLRKLAPTLERVPAPYKIGIEGHTDDAPIFSRAIRDNWELSSKRALAVFYALRLSSGTLKRTIVMAHGDTEPIAPNRTPAGVPIPQNQAKNRRVTLKIF